jgi:hypothetical protein
VPPADLFVALRRRRCAALVVARQRRRATGRTGATCARPARNEGVEAELYDLAEDSAEAQDIAAKHPERVKDLRAATTRWPGTQRRRLADRRTGLPGAAGAGGTSLAAGVDAITMPASWCSRS